MRHRLVTLFGGISPGAAARRVVRGRGPGEQRRGGPRQGGEDHRVPPRRCPRGDARCARRLNARLKKDLNASMEINYIGWGDFQAKYPLVLAAGEDIDWIYTANWSFYFQEAAKGPSSSSPTSC